MVLPAILAHSEDEARARIAQLPESVSMIHVDIMDGIFVPNTTWADPVRLHALLPDGMTYEAHFMVADPSAFFRQWQFPLILKRSGVRPVKKCTRMIFHVEAIDHIIERAAYIRGIGIEFWLAWNPGTPDETIGKTLDHIDGILVMANMPGFQGKEADIEGTVRRIRFIRSQNANLPIGVDIGVNPKTAPLFRAAGATVLVSGSYLFADDGKTMEEKIAALT